MAEHLFSLRVPETERTLALSSVDIVEDPEKGLQVRYVRDQGHFVSVDMSIPEGERRKLARNLRRAARLVQRGG